MMYFQGEVESCQQMLNGLVCSSHLEQNSKIYERQSTLEGLKHCDEMCT